MGKIEGQAMGDMSRTHNLGELRIEDVGQKVVLMGWVASRRDHGGVIFTDLRDRWGVTQVVFSPQTSAQVHSEAEQIRSEYVMAIEGEVAPRDEGMTNPNLGTGEIEVMALKLVVLNVSKSPPFPIERGGSEVSEEIRLRYRYLDLRRPEMQQNLLLRHKTYQIVRKQLSDQDFIEVETPFLMKSTPEGARDFLVPSRLQQGSFYALPQSPQTYKQLLMVGGYDRYFQIVKCFRDEDLRADRQPEFTQIDIEMAFVDQNRVMGVAEELMRSVFKGSIGVDIPASIERMTYDDTMNRYGVDKPDRRFGLELIDLTDIAGEADFRVFCQAVEGGGVVKAINLPGGSDISRTAIENQLTPFVKTYG
ncbi:MAG: aspartate--tRNA ligase, partial [Candidatus Latescibacteria bacterium]|nr:aspartate--tRNA ligase [Candidatus Latescibacterota bacterium]